MSKNIKLELGYFQKEIITLPDSDDILSKNIFYICYKYSEKYNLEIIWFNMSTENGKITLRDIINNIENSSFIILI